MGTLTRVVSSGPSPDPRRSSPSTRSYWSRRTFELAPPQRASSRSEVGRVERRGARPRQPVPVRRRGRSVRCGGSGRQWMRYAGSTDRDLVTGIAATTTPPERGSTCASFPRTDSCRGAPHTHGTVNAACGWRTCRSRWSLRPVLGSEGRTRWCGPPRAASDRAWPSLDDSVLPAGPPGTAVGSCRTPSDCRDFAGRFRSCPAVVTAGLGSSTRSGPLELIDLRSVGVARRIHRRVCGDTVVTRGRSV